MFFQRAAAVLTFAILLGITPFAMGVEDPIIRALTLRKITAHCILSSDAGPGLCLVTINPFIELAGGNKNEFFVKDHFTKFRTGNVLVILTYYGDQTCEVKNLTTGKNYTGYWKYPGD